MTRLNNDLRMPDLRDIGYAALELADELVATHADADVLLVAIELVRGRMTRSNPLRGTIARSIAGVAERTLAEKRRETEAVETEFERRTRDASVTLKAGEDC